MSRAAETFFLAIAALALFVVGGLVLSLRQDPEPWTICIDETLYVHTPDAVDKLTPAGPCPSSP